MKGKPIYTCDGKSCIQKYPYNEQKTTEPAKDGWYWGILPTEKTKDRIEIGKFLKDEDRSFDAQCCSIRCILKWAENKLIGWEDEPAVELGPT